MSWIDEFVQSGGKTDRALTFEDGRDYFSAVREALGRDLGRARALCKLWRRVANHPGARPWGIRCRAVLQRLDGRWSASAASFVEASRLLHDPDRSSFLVGAIDSLGRAGRADEALALAKRVVKRVGPEGAAQVCLNAGNAMIWHDRYQEASRWFERALEGSNKGFTAGAARLGLSTCHLYGGHPRQAQSNAAIAVELFQSIGADQHTSMAALNLAQALGQMGRHDESLSKLLALRGDFDPESVEAHRLEEFIGDAYYRLNLYTEAEDSFLSALRHVHAGTQLLNRANCHLGLGCTLVEMSRPEHAVPHFRAASRAYAKFGNSVWAAVATLKLCEANGRGKVPRLRKCLQSLEKAGSRFWLIQVHLALAEASPVDSRASVAAAERLIRASGHEQFLWRCYRIRSRIEPAQRRKWLRKMAESMFDSLELVATSQARRSYWADKSDALSEFVIALLQSPTRRSRDEALSAVRRSAMPGIAESVLRSGAGEESLRAELRTISDDLSSALRSEESPGTSRRWAGTTGDLRKLQRRWGEATRQLCEFQRTEQASPCPDWVWVDNESSSVAFNMQETQTVREARKARRSALQWFRFELMAPMLLPGADPTLALEGLGCLSRKYLSFGDRPVGGLVTVCPSGPLWDLPWAAMAAVRDSEAVVSLGPWRPLADWPMASEPNVVVWYQDSDRLPHIAQEVENVCKVFPKAVVCQSLTEVRSMLGPRECDLLHIATHSSFHPTNPMFSSFVFRDGHLTAAEVARSGLRPRYAVLSGCETGTLGMPDRSEPDGLSRSILDLGAQAVVANAWPVDDAAAALFTRALYTNWQDVGFVEGMRAARKAVRDQRPHPYFWGPFTIFGGRPE